MDRYKQSIIDNEYILVELERTREDDIELYWFHCDIKKWTHTLYKQYIKVMFDIQDRLKAEGVDVLYGLVQDEKNAKFAEMFGWEYLITDAAGKKIYIMEIV